MLVFMSRYGKAIEHAFATAHAATLSIFDNASRGGGLTKRTVFATADEAGAELEKFVARRQKAGWKIQHRIENPWVAWINDLERLHDRVIDDAKASGVAIGPRSCFKHGWTEVPPSDTAPHEYAELLRIGHPRLHFQLGDAALSFDIQFKVGGWLRGQDGEELFWQRRDHDRMSDFGSFTGEILESHLDEEVVRHARAEEFRAWFPRYVRDGVMGFVIAELAR